MKFKCSACAACCISAGIDGRMPDRGDGACAFLTEDLLCEIFETRPDICRVDKMHELIQIIYPEVTKKEYYTKATLVCHALIDSYNLDPKYKIDINIYNDMEQEKILNKMKNNNERK